MNAIFKRTSVRKYTEEPVSDEHVEILMRAAMAAPSAHNQQPWEFFVVRDRETLESMSEVTSGSGPLAKAPLGIVACSRTEGLMSPWAVQQDMSASMQNILLEATELGLGGVWMGLQGFPEWIEKIHEIIGKPEGIVPFGMIAVGHPAKEREPRGPKNYDESRIHWI